jgi:hypothetical protein
MFQHHRCHRRFTLRARLLLAIIHRHYDNLCWHNGVFADTTKEVDF